MKKFLLVSALCLSVNAHAYAMDSTALFNENVLGTSIQQAASVAPVGTVITWPAGSKDPDDAANWLECNGQSTAGYPELAAIVGANVPNYNNQFLRGGSRAQAGQVVADSTRSHAHQVDQHSHTVSGSAGQQSYSAPASGGGSGYAVVGGAGFSSSPQGGHIGGGIYASSSSNSNGDNTEYSSYIPVGGGGSTSAMTSGGSITGITDRGGATSTYTSGGVETAPQHIRVRYLIRALP